MSNLSTCSSSSPASSEHGFFQPAPAQQHHQLLLDGTISHEDNDWSFMKAEGLTPTHQVAQPPPKRASWSRRLVVTKQPASEFYKDEGGKSNSLDVEVTLVEFNEHGEPARSPDDEFIDIPLRILLFFESGKRVDDTDQEIFRFVGNDYDSVVIRGNTRKASVQFRLEKVSRRKDGQRFKLRIEVDQEQCTANVSDLTPIFTNAICVLSKRKHHSSVLTESSVRTKEPSAKVVRRDLVRLEEKLGDKIDAVLAEMSRMNRQIQKQVGAKLSLLVPAEFFNELLARFCVPIPAATATLGSLSDHTSLEWLLKTNLGEDHTIKSIPQQQQQQQQHLHSQPNGSGTSLGHYLSVSSDDSYETETQFSPSSSDMSVVEILPSSLSFAEF